MDDGITAALNGEEYLESLEFDSITTEPLVDDDINSFVNRLHEALDLYQLFDTFNAEFRAAVPCDSVEYIHEKTQTSLINGITGKQQCVYTLRYEKKSLGRMSITRDTEFLDKEIETIEVMLAGLILPLRNALRYKQAINQAQRDELTGLRNGSYYHDVVDQEIKRAQRYKKPFSLLMFDIDDFENINHDYGRSGGDAVLVEVAKRIEKKARSSDIVYRNNGDEFLIFLPNTEKSKAIEAAERIKDFVMSNKCAFENNVIPFSLSAGVVTVIYADTASKLLDRATKSLFHAKILGKNRIYSELPPESLQAGYL